MSATSRIEWTQSTWNVTAGCAKVSAGCKHCYAMGQAHRMAGNPNPKLAAAFAGTTNLRAEWTGEVRTLPERLMIPLRWQRGRRIFVNSLSDLFHPAVPFPFVDQVFAVMALSPRHTFQVLTKRPRRMAEYLNDPETPMKVLEATLALQTPATRFANQAGLEGWWPLANVEVGTSVEDQPAAEERIPELLRCLARVRFLSCEPLLGGLALMPWLVQGGIHLVICGGESGPRARPMHPDWPRKLRDDCQAAGVAFFFKQWGEWAPGECADTPQTRTEQTATWWDGAWQFDRQTPGYEGHCEDEPDLFRLGKRAAGRMLDGVEHNALPDGTEGSDGSNGSAAGTGTGGCGHAE